MVIGIVEIFMPSTKMQRSAIVHPIIIVFAIANSAAFQGQLRVRCGLRGPAS